MIRYGESSYLKQTKYRNPHDTSEVGIYLIYYIDDVIVNKKEGSYFVWGLWTGYISEKW